MKKGKIFGGIREKFVSIEGVEITILVFCGFFIFGTKVCMRFGEVCMRVEKVDRPGF